MDLIDYLWIVIASKAVLKWKKCEMHSAIWDFVLPFEPIAWL